MKKMFTFNSKSRSRWMLLLLLLVAGVTNTLAQNVTVHPGNGSMLPARKNTTNSDTFFRWRGFATWKHEQLSLTMTTGDSDNNLTNASNQLTGNGQLQNPANNIFATPSNTTGAARYLQIGKGGINGNVMDTYVTVVLPKGYRFTGYSITFHRISYPTSDGIRYSSNRGRIYYTNDYGNEDYSSLNATSANISFGETDNTFAYTSTTNTSTQNVTSYRGGIAQNNTTTQYTIGRTSQTSTDMTNVLYFKLSAGNNDGRAFIQLDKMELYFTAEYNTPTLIPAQTATERSAVDIPFTTGKVDYDELTNRTDEVTRISYNGTIRDMNANMTLYEKGSTRTVSAADNDFDGTAGLMVNYGKGSISSAGNYFKLESDKHPLFKDDGEAIYYIESPTWATNSAAANTHKNPIGYRIVSATFNYGPGSGSVYLPAIFKIQYESDGHGPNEDGTYGLNVYSGTYNWNPSYHTSWRIDQDGYIYGYNTANNGTYYLTLGVDQQGNENFIMATEKPSAANGTFEITTDNQIRLISDPTKYIGWKETVTGTYTDDNGETNDDVDREFVIAADEAHRSIYNELSPATTGTHGEYVLKIYGPDGETVAKTINVGETGGSETVYGYNNDAIKIGVVGTALINAEVTMQALDPYIDRMDIVCQENGGNGGTLTQQFNATDFSVRGGKFTFYVPEGFPAPAKFSFNNLYSSYGDNSYYSANNNPEPHARYFFVKSPYEQTDANVYRRDEGASYTTKIKTEKVGSTKFRFNNASTVSTTGGYFEEYAFSPSNYTGSFNDFTFSETEMSNGTTKTAYLFTCDETRYNIAPTTATQHVFYAFYEMNIDMKSKTYQPILTWEKVYDENKTFENGGKTDSKWGLRLTTTETVDDHGTHSGYLTVKQILDKIGDRTGDNTVAGGPKNTDQILFIDGSKLMSIVENTNTKSELMAALGQNALIYLPYGSKSSDDNFAFNTEEDYSKTPTFRAANDIVLTDKYTFYAPYNIQVDAAKSAKYTRQITKSTYTDETYATVIMPFEIKLESGQHADSYGTLEFLQMNATNATSDKYYNYGPTVFFSKTDAEKVEANTPYALHVVRNNGNDGAFTVNQTGATVVATPAAAKAASNSLFSATEITATGNLTDKDGVSNTYTFSHKGSFSGYKIPKDNPKTFYFANGGFYSSAELNKNYSTVDLLPFRSVYQVTSGGSAKVGFLHFIEGENNTTGIVDIEKKNYSGITTGDGTITITSNAAGTYRIFSAAGQTANTVVLKAGETRTVNVPAGVYLVNGVKVLVK